MTESSKVEAERVLQTFRVGGSCLYIVGTFDTGVTVFSQQTRALNLVWALVESEVLPAAARKDSLPTQTKKKIAIVGAGFAGLTFAAGLLKKGAHANVTVFEQRDALLPLQQGSDSRWLHPRIYDWPKTGSEASVAMLPVLNWTAARASDVVVQVLSQWKSATSSAASGVTLYCNARHLQVHETSTPSKQLRLEWVGEQRRASDGTARADVVGAEGKSDDFDLVILTVGFGVERDGAHSYWRNETLGQPSLDEPRRTYLVSGQGDGAMIDLLRVRISQYRQDRILEEVFAGRSALYGAVGRLYAEYSLDPHKVGLFADLEKLETEALTKTDFIEAGDALRRRLRRDTDAILRLQVRKLSQLFDPGTSKISFQNKLLVFLLYKCGGFVPSTLSEDKLTKQHQIPDDLVIRRHGTLRDDHLKQMLSETLYKAIETQRGSARPDPFSQNDAPSWPGGYFDFPGPRRTTGQIEDEQRSQWRKEYLPGPTQMIAAAFCSALAGFLLTHHPKNKRLRVTLHRAMVFSAEELLQQSCDYEGTGNARASQSAAGRTFPARNGTIGQAYLCRRIVRSAKGVSAEHLNGAMQLLSLNEASRKMSGEVSFVIAIPLLEPEDGAPHTLPSPVLGVIYIDSTAPGFYIDDKMLKQVVLMATTFLASLKRAAEQPIERIRNLNLTGIEQQARAAQKLPNKVAKALQTVDTVDVPRTDSPLQLNFDYSDFVVVGAGASR